MVDVSPGGDGSVCQLMIFENPFPFNLIGIPGFRGYYTVHDPDNSRIGFVPTLDEVKSPLTRGDRPTQ